MNVVRLNFSIHFLYLLLQFEMIYGYIDTNSDGWFCYKAEKTILLIKVLF